MEQPCLARLRSGREECQPMIGDVDAGLLGVALFDALSKDAVDFIARESPELQ